MLAKRVIEVCIFLNVLLLVLLNGSAEAASQQSQSIHYRLTIRPSLSVACPTAPVNLGEWEQASSPSGQRVTCHLKQNVPSGGMVQIAASPATDALNLTESASGATYPLRFSSYQLSSGTYQGGSFQSGLRVNMTGKEAAFSFMAEPEAHITPTQHSGVYQGQHQLTFSLI